PLNAPPTTDLYSLSLHDALPIYNPAASVELCGISMMERSLRTLQACGFTRALILTDSEELMSETCRASSPDWTKIVWNFSARRTDRKSTRLNSSHVSISYAVFWL